MIRLAEVSLDVAAAHLLGNEYASKYLVLPIGLEGGHLRVAMRAPFDEVVIQHLVTLTGKFILPLAADEDDLRFYINKVFGEDEMNTIVSQFVVNERVENAEISAEVLAEISSAPVVRFIDSLIDAGTLNRASDIHVEPFGQKMRARYRLDGRLVTYGKVDISLLSNVISRLKIMGGLNIAEKRIPQDGHFSMVFEDKLGEKDEKDKKDDQGEKIDFRLSTMPTAFGEKAVLRLLYGQNARLKKEDLGFFEDDLQVLIELFTRPYGAIFMTGPTGSGKSTTLNCFLQVLDSETLNIITVEDPVENPILGVNHVNVEPQAGFTFASALRHILRQDPDVIMIGEIRDEETARIAIQAAITGHVVLSTLHTNDAAGVIERLSDMGIEPYLAAAALNGVISQRLVRRICKECSAPTTLTPTQARLLNLPQDTQVYEGAGCAHCNLTGFRSRFAVYEYIIMNEKMRRHMSTNPAEFAAELRKRGGLRANAIRSLLKGFTTADEVIRALNHDGVEDENE
ncbi:MAG: GspE/PulE family protein [Defluviitaleaceae bacterium]|nr:GspE/PulE family protein [Defluviitaleaceae bacterium]